MTSPGRLTLTALAVPVAICRLDPGEWVPPWTNQARSFLTISRTESELSIVADDAAVPAGVHARRGYRVLRVEGPLPFELVGVLAALAGALAAADVSIFAIATYDTDYVLVAGEDLSRAVTALQAAGHVVVAPAPTTPAA